MDAGDYLINEMLSRNKNNRLLDYDTDEPNPELTSQSERALAEIAAAIHKNARHLEPEQAEVAVRWLKKWKLTGQPQPQNDIYLKLVQIKASSEQVSLEGRAARKTLMAGLLLVCCVAFLAVGLLLHIARVDWYWRVLLLVPIYFLGMKANSRLTEGINLYKEQDRRYLMQSLRAARTPTELNIAGLFAYLPGTTPADGSSYDEKEAMRQLALERERFGDALYNDPDDYLGAWNWR
jgi:hypothetical protein